MPDTKYFDKDGPINKDKVEEEMMSAKEEALNKEIQKLKKELEKAQEKFNKASKTEEERKKLKDVLLEKQKKFPKYMLRDLRRSDPVNKRTCSLCLKRKPIEDFRYTVSEECEECSLLGE